MRKNKLAAEKAVKRDLTAIALPTKLPLKKIISMLEDLTYQALKTGNTDKIQEICQKQLLALLDANTEVAVLKGGRRGQLSAEKVIDEPLKEIMPVRLSLDDNSTIQAQGTADYLKRISGIDPTKTNDAFKKQNAVLIKNLSKEISDRIKKTIVDLTEQGVHIKGGKTEIANILLKAGIDPAAAPKVAETIFRTQSAAAYNAGRWNIVNDPDTKDYIWGFEYVTAHDRRVRPEHRLLEGVRLPKEDPFWQRFLPPNGWNCRCTVLEIWNDEDIAKIDFGITGVDPRTRSIKELNLLPAFDGNVGVLAGEGHNAKIGKKGAITDTRRTYKPTQIQALPKPIKVEEPITLPEPEPEPEYLPVVYDIQPDIQELSTHGKPALINLIVDEVNGGKEFVIRERTGRSKDSGKIFVRILQKGVSFDADNKVWRVKWENNSYPNRDFVSVKNALNFIIDEIADNGIPKDSILLTYKVKGKTISDPDFPTDSSAIKQIKRLGGSTEAFLVEDEYGEKMVKKTSKNTSPEHVQNETEADKFYRTMGIAVPESRVYKNPDGSATRLSKYIDDSEPLEEWWSKANDAERNAMRQELLKGFAIDIILNARDVVGSNGDNILVDKEGTPWRIDNGGTMSFRARGGKHSFEDWEQGFPNELLTMTDSDKGAQKQKYFGKVSVLEAVDMIANIDKKKWDKAISQLPKKDADVVKKRLEECIALANIGNENLSQGKSKEEVNKILIAVIRIKQALPILNKGKATADQLIIEKYKIGFPVVDGKGKKFCSIKLKKDLYLLQTGTKIEGQYTEMYPLLVDMREKFAKKLNIQPEGVFISFEKGVIIYSKATVIEAVEASGESVPVDENLENNFNTKTGIRIRKKNNDAYYKMVESKIEKYAKDTYGISVDEYLQRANEQLKKIFAQSAIYIRANFRVAKLIIGDHSDPNNIIPSDRFKTQFETNTSNGMNNKQKRSQDEYRQFGYKKYNASKPTDQSFRPIYGSFWNKDISKAKSERSFSGSRQYGGIIFEMKDDIWKRTTWTTNDSLFRKNPSYSFLDNPSILSLNDYDRLRDVLTMNSLDELATGSYMEIQIHGSVGFGSVRHIWIDERALHWEGVSANDAEQELNRRLTNTGITCKIIQ